MQPGFQLRSRNVQRAFDRRDDHFVRLANIEQYRVVERIVERVRLDLVFVAFIFFFDEHRVLNYGSVSANGAVWVSFETNFSRARAQAFNQ